MLMFTCFMQVYTRLHKLNLTVSHKSLTKLVGTLGNDFDLIVMRDWRDPYIPLLNATIVSSIIIKFMISICYN